MNIIESDTGCSVENLTWGQVWPSEEEFGRLYREGYRVIPVITSLLADSMSPLGFYERLAHGRPGTFILESADSTGSWSRYSFIGVNSLAQLSSTDGNARWTGQVPQGVPSSGSITEVIRETLKILKSPNVKGLPNMTSGLVGSIGWDCIRQWEPTLSSEAVNETGQPMAALTLASDVAVVDHYKGSVWLVSNAVKTDSNADEKTVYRDALKRLERMRDNALTPVSAEDRISELDETVPEPVISYRTPCEQFENAVNKVKEHIVKGDAFQIVLSQRLDIDSPGEPLDVYRVLRVLNPSTYMFFLHLNDENGDFYIVGSSPETLIRVDDGHAVTYPIAGSRPRGASEEEDARLKKELLSDYKERSEHIMLVDLSRNDLSKVCDAQTVEVTKLMDVKKFSHIMHICSAGEGDIKSNMTTFDVFESSFPAGTLSGAPKIRAIDIIDELEPADRGIYGGTVGYFDFSGNMDMAITIRTAFIRNGRASVQSGAGIVLDSDPHAEWTETRNKEAASVRAIQIAAKVKNVNKQRL